jgi:hypothetical protein
MFVNWGFDIVENSVVDFKDFHKIGVNTFDNYWRMSSCQQDNHFTNVTCHSLSKNLIVPGNWKPGKPATGSAPWILSGMQKYYLEDLAQLYMYTKILNTQGAARPISPADKGKKLTKSCKLVQKHQSTINWFSVFLRLIMIQIPCILPNLDDQPQEYGEPINGRGGLQHCRMAIVGFSSGIWAMFF